MTTNKTITVAEATLVQGTYIWCCMGCRRSVTTQDANTVERFAHDEVLLKCPRCRTVSTVARERVRVEREAFPGMPKATGGIVKMPEYIVGVDLAADPVEKTHAVFIEGMRQQLIAGAGIPAKLLEPQHVNSRCIVAPEMTAEQRAAFKRAFEDSFRRRGPRAAFRVLPPQEDDSMLDLHARLHGGPGSARDGGYWVPSHVQEELTQQEPNVVACGRGFALMKRGPYPTRNYMGRSMRETGPVNCPVECVVSDPFESRDGALAAWRRYDAQQSEEMERKRSGCTSSDSARGMSLRRG